MKTISTVLLLLFLALPAFGQPMASFPATPTLPTNYIFTVENPSIKTWKSTINTLINTMRSNLVASGVGTNVNFSTNLFITGSNTVAAGANVTVTTNITASNVTFTVSTTPVATPAAPLSSVQYNSNGVMQGSTGFIYTNGQVRVADIVVAGQGVEVTAGSIILNGGTTALAVWNGFGNIRWEDDGVARINDDASLGFNRLELGGTDASFPAIGRTNGDVIVFGANGAFGHGASTNRLLVPGGIQLSNVFRVQQGAGTIGQVLASADTLGTAMWTNSSGGSAGTNIAVGQTIYLDAAFGNDATASRTNALRPFLTVSNAIAAMLSGDTLVVRGGTYPILPKADTAGQPSGAHNVAGVALTNKSNIRIVGEPGAIWAMSAQWSNSCPMMTLYACTNVLIEGMTFRGIRTNLAVLQDFAIMLKYCDGVTFTGNKIQSWQNQGISDISQTAINRNIRILNNDFSDCGGTNQITQGADGTAISVIASNLVITGNRFYRNLRDMEICCNGDARGLIYENNISEACYEASVLLISTNTSEARIVNNIASGYALNSVSPGTTWLLFNAGSNIVVQGNQIGGYSNGIVYAPSAGVRFVDIGIYDNVFNDCISYPISIHSATAVAANVERISIMRNKFKNAAAQAVTLSANHSRIEDNEMADCNTSQTVGGVIRVGFTSGFYTNSTNISIVGNKIYTSHMSANSSTGIVIYGLSHSNSVWGNEVARNYAATLHDLGVGTLTMPLNKITPGRMLYSDTNSRMAASTMTVSSNGAVSIGDLSVDNFYANHFFVTNAPGSNVVRLGYQDLTNIIRRQTIYADAGCMISNSTDGATFSTEETSSPTNRMYDSYVFSGTVTNLVQFKFTMPLNWDLSTVKVKLWTSSTNNIVTTTNVWGISASTIKSGSVITNINWGTELNIVNTVSSTGGQATLTPATAALTIGNTPAAAGNLVWFRIRRLPGHVDDNDGGQQKVLGAWIQYGETMSEVASW